MYIVQGENNLVVPIHAFPVLNTSEFPTFVDFSLVPVGETCVAISSSNVAVQYESVVMSGCACH